MKKNLLLLLCAAMTMFAITSCMQEEELSSSVIEEIEAVTDIPVEVEGFSIKSTPAIVEPAELEDAWWKVKTRGLIVESGSIKLYVGRKAIVQEGYFIERVYR